MPEMPRYEVCLRGRGFHVPVADAFSPGDGHQDERVHKLPGAVIQEIMTTRRVRATDEEDAFVAARNALCVEDKMGDYVRISVMNGCHPEFEVVSVHRLMPLDGLFSRCDERLIMADNSDHLV